MHMLESCAHFQAMSASQLAGTLTRFVAEVRAVLIDPEARLPLKLAAIEVIVNAVAPPPPPCDFPWRPDGRTRARGNSDGTGEALVLTAGTAVTRSPVPS
jgi:hypothetical protein